MAFASLENLEKKNKVDALYRIARNRRDKDSRAAIAALGRIGTADAARALLKLSQHDDFSVWDAAQHEISHLKNVAATPVLLEALGKEGQNPTPILGGLCSIGSPEAMEGAIRALENPDLSAQALTVLKKSRDPQVITAMERLLQQQLQTPGEAGQVRYLLWSNSLCRSVLTTLGELASVPAIQVLHRFLREHGDAPARLRIQAARELCGCGELGRQALAGYLGEDFEDMQRAQLLIQCLPNDELCDLLFEHLEGKAADGLAQTLVTCLNQMDESLWPSIIALLDRLNRESARSALLLWLVQTKAASKEAGYLLARYGDTKPVLVKRLVDMVHLEEQPIRKKAGDLLHALYTDKLIGEEGVQLIKVLPDEEGSAQDYKYIGPEL